MAWFRCKLHQKKDTTVSYDFWFPNQGYVRVDKYVGDTLVDSFQLTQGTCSISSYPYYKIEGSKLSIRWRSNLASWYFYSNGKYVEYNGTKYAENAYITSTSNSPAGHTCGPFKIVDE